MNLLNGLCTAGLTFFLAYELVGIMPEKECQIKGTKDSGEGHFTQAQAGSG